MHQTCQSVPYWEHWGQNVKTNLMEDWGWGPVAQSVERLTCHPVYSGGAGSSPGLGGTVTIFSPLLLIDHSDESLN